MSSWYIKDITIDSREKLRGHEAYAYYINNNYDVNVQSLPFGDYLFTTNDNKQAIFEFKTCEDFINSMQNKTLFNELSNQTIHYEYSYLIICGNFDSTFEYLYFNVPHFRYKYKTKQSLTSRLRKQVTGALSRIYAMYIPIVIVEDNEEAFERMLKISSKIADSKKYGGIVRPSSKKSLKEIPCATFLTTIDGIGEKKAKNIANELDITCLNDLCKLKPSDFLSVSNVTDKNVCELWEKIHNEKLEL